MIPVVLSGGSGTRLWPVSRASYPKQFCEFYDGSFLENSLHRLKTLGDVYILTTQSMDALTQRAVRNEALNPQNVILEPMGKNTAPAVALLCHILETRGHSGEIVGVFPSDHLIADEAAFQRAVRLAERVASNGYIVTLGIEPTGPETGYGYIQLSSELVDKEDGLAARRVLRFREKPSVTTAKEYLANRDHVWNAGMFVFRVSDMIQSFREFQPQIWEKISQIQPDMSNATYNYAMVQSISLDYAVMEKAAKQACVPCDMGWSDVGSWDEVARIAEESTQIRSRSKAQVFNQDSENNYVFSVQNKVVGLIDVTDVILVDTPDALLVVRKGSSQKVKELVDTMRMAGLPEATLHPFEHRPWGGFEVLADEREFKSKKITIDPGGRISYQSHAKRAEHWVIVLGEAEVTLDEKIIHLRPGQSVHIPVGSKHRIFNPGKSPLVFVEVQTGSYFGEDDIVRYQDDYNRVKTEV
jgi:mannose-1-phosphate guanylyltransferase/mannose-1-phosphate guanylyltransferase/mannose-6-phosphate isomerase